MTLTKKPKVCSELISALFFSLNPQYLKPSDGPETTFNNKEEIWLLYETFFIFFLE